MQVDGRLSTARRQGLPQLLAALAMILCCSCQLTPQRTADTATMNGPASPPAVMSPTMPAPPLPGTNPPADYGVQLAAYAPQGLPASAWTGQPNSWAASAAAPPGCAACPPCADGVAGPTGPWRPPGIAGRWPYNEYLCDGGDQGARVEVGRDRTVWGLDQEDTVAHYDTVDGRTEVEASNPVCLYAPRFAAVRQVSGLAVHEVHDRLAGVNLPVLPSAQEYRNGPTTVLQPVEAERYVGTKGPQIFRERARGEAIDGTQALAKFDTLFSAHEDFLLIRTGNFDNTEKARLAERLEAAVAWTENQAVQVTIDTVTARIATNDVSLQSVYSYELPPGKPRLRVVKVASKKSAQPGDEVDFTIRFDNVGDQSVDHVTISDSLTTRLEYVPDTAQCDREASFGTQQNDGESLVLRWEIRSPLPVGQGGIIRFKCRVR